MAKVIEHVQARYEVQDVEFGKVYKWRDLRASWSSASVARRRPSRSLRTLAQGVGRIIEISSKKCWRSVRRIRSSAPGAHCALTTYPPVVPRMQELGALKEDRYE